MGGGESDKRSGNEGQRGGLKDSEPHRSVEGLGTGVEFRLRDLEGGQDVSARDHESLARRREPQLSSRFDRERHACLPFKHRELLGDRGRRIAHGFCRRQRWCRARRTLGASLSRVRSSIPLVKQN